MWELDYKESWAPKNWCFWTVVLDKTLESPLHCKEIQPVHSEGDQPWDFFGRTDAKAETPVLWPPHVKSWLIGKDPDAGRDKGKEEKGTTEDEIPGWYHWLDGHVWVNSGSWWWTGRSGVLPFMGSQRVRQDWTEWVGGLFHLFGEGVEISRNWAIPWSFDMLWNYYGASGCVFSLLTEDQGLIKVNLSAILDPFDSNCFILCPWGMSFFQKFCPAPFLPVTR